jgi:hypothetical protein
MAQTDIETLDSLPIKNVGADGQSKIIELVDRILSSTKSNDYLENSEKQSEVRAHEIKIDKLVYELYGLTREEIGIVS